MFTITMIDEILADNPGDPYPIDLDLGRSKRTAENPASESAKKSKR